LGNRAQNRWDLPFVLIRADVDEDTMPEARYVFLPNGALVQSIPRRLTIQAGDRTLLTADITVQAAGQVDPATFELPGESADPGTTLRPLRDFEVRPPGTDERCSTHDDLDIPMLPLVTREIIDRHGVIQEVELLDARKLDVKAKSRGVANILDCRRKMKVQPATIDKSPAEFPRRVFLGPPLLSHK
jgi:hypothetical protein